MDRSRDQLAGAMALKRQEIADELAKASAAYGTERGKLDTLIAHQGRHAALTFEIESAKRGMDQVTDRMHEIGLQKINNSKVVKWEEAEENPNPVPFKPNWRQNIMFGVILSFVLAGALVAGLEQIDDTVRTPRDIEQRIGAVVLGAVPACGRKSMDRDGYFLAKRQTSSIAVDCMRGIHIGLEVGRKGAVQNGALVITVTSAVPEDGKSFITSNLGILFASLGRRVLVVDADLRKASLSKAFDAGDRNGFFEILTSQKWTKEFAIIETKSGYSLLSAGRTKNSVSESLHPESVSNMLELMRKDFDVIIFDTPPVLALPDACVLGQMSDITVLVTRSRHTQMAQIERAAASLFTAKVKELSFVVNGLDAADAATDTYGSGYGYGYGNGYGHGYGYGREDSGGKHKKLPKPPNVGGMTDPNEDDEDDQN